MQYHWKLLKSPYKYTKTFILLTAQKKTAIAMAANMKKKTYFAENKVKVHVFEVPVCGLVDWAFVILCVWLLKKSM